MCILAALIALAVLAAARTGSAAAAAADIFAVAGTALWLTHIYTGTRK